ncbi:MAG: hypothetical protein AAF490_22035 [Chloroflexota bacterium]
MMKNNYMRKAQVLLTAVIPLTALALLFSLFTPQAKAAVVGGNITEDTTWTLANSPYIVEESLFIEPGVTLTIEPGVDVHVEKLDAPGINIVVWGSLIVNGTAQQPVTFRSATETTHSSWLGISIAESGFYSINYADIQHAILGFDVYGLPALDSIIQNSKIHNNYYAGSTMINNIHRLNMQNMSFENNEINRVLISSNDDMEALVGDTTISMQNGLEGYQVYDSDEFDNYFVFSVPLSVTLTVEPGVSLFMANGGFISVAGQLNAIGTPIKPISFTSIINTGPEAWQGITFGQIGSGTLENIIIENGNFALNAYHFTSTKEVIVKNSLLQNNNYGVGITFSAINNLEMDNVTFLNNENNKVQIEVYHKELIEDVILTKQPGLESYEFINYGNNFAPRRFYIGENAKMTMEAGTTFETNMSIIVSGTLSTLGTSTQPVHFNLIQNEYQAYFIFPGQGYANINHTFFIGENQDDIAIAIGVSEVGEISYGTGDISIRNSLITENNIPIFIAAHALHALSMENVTFGENLENIIYLDTGGPVVFQEDIILTPQVGLEGYYLPLPADYSPNKLLSSFTTKSIATNATLNYGSNYLSQELKRDLLIPLNVSMTFEPGATLIMTDSTNLHVQGELNMAGTAESPAIITGKDAEPGSWGGVVVEGGTVSLNHPNIFVTGDVSTI